MTAKVLHEAEFDTVLGKIGFDEKGITGIETFAWYVWQGGALCTAPDD